jgi:hypothetical protein
MEKCRILSIYRLKRWKRINSMSDIVEFAKQTRNYRLNTVTCVWQPLPPSNIQAAPCLRRPEGPSLMDKN